jgi:hypothetical protein
MTDSTPPIGPPYYLSLSTEEPTQDDQHEVSGGDYERVNLADDDGDSPSFIV